MRHGEDRRAGDGADRPARRGIEAVDDDSVPVPRHAMDDAVRRDRVGEGGGHAAREPVIAFGPGQPILAGTLCRPPASSGEIVNTAPGRDMMGLDAITVDWKRP